MNFHYFAQLPKELQLAIWRECLPRRVVELDAPHQVITSMDLDAELQGTTGCELWHTSRVNVRPPVISRVCRDSRTLALAKAGFVISLDARVAFGCSMSRFWLDRARDIVHLNWEPAYDPQFVRIGDPLTYWMSVAAGAVGASLTEDGFQTIINSHESSLTAKSFVGMAKCCHICLKMVSIHADAESAIHSGLFGTLGEERIVLVDARDNDRKKQFKNFWENHGSQSDRQAAHFFDMYASEDGVGWANRTIENLRMVWLARLWRQQVTENGTENMGDAWLERTEEDRDMMPFVGHRRKPNLQNSWMSATIQSLPVLLPTIMFRLCTQRCT